MNSDKSWHACEITTQCRLHGEHRATLCSEGDDAEWMAEILAMALRRDGYTAAVEYYPPFAVEPSTGYPQGVTRGE